MTISSLLAQKFKFYRLSIESGSGELNLSDKNQLRLIFDPETFGFIVKPSLDQRTFKNEFQSVSECEKLNY